MRCPFCSYHDSKVIDSRTRDGGRTIRRRRECLKCQRRFTTREQLDEIPLWVIKQDNRREEFDRQKLVRSLQVACIKRPVSMAAIACARIDHLAIMVAAEGTSHACIPVSVMICVYRVGI